MSEEKTQAEAVETVETETPEAAEPAADAEKLFTQAEVDRIVKERLKRVKVKAAEEQESESVKKAANLAQREADLNARETKLKCKEWLHDQGYSKDLLDILDLTDFETFKKKADKVVQLSAGMKTKSAPVASESITGNDGAGDGFSKENSKHKPKPYF